MDAMRDNPLLDFSGLPRFDAITLRQAGDRARGATVAAAGAEARGHG